eukprot:78797-Prorocentrum_minimum.AAC.1
MSTLVTKQANEHVCNGLNLTDRLGPAGARAGGGGGAQRGGSGGGGPKAALRWLRVAAGGGPEGV